MSLSRAILRSIGWGGRQRKVSPRNVVFISGCDSGLGFALSLFCHSLNMTVISACHSVNSEGAVMLQHLNDPKRMITIELDLLRQDTITQARRFVSELMLMNNDYVFTALVNNAGVMCFGEFEWQTRAQIDMQINVNLLGTMRLTKEMLPLVRQHRGRIINITSHCSLQALPTVSTYAATKAALRFWTDALRVEMHQYGVEVVNFIPGSFIMNSNISARQPEHAKYMWNEMTEEQREFYGPYFHKLNDYLQVISGFKAANQMQDVALLNTFKDALMNTQPRHVYVHEPFRYKLYHLLFSICPTPIVDWLTMRFCNMPNYRQVMAATESTGNGTHEKTPASE